MADSTIAGLGSLTDINRNVDVIPIFDIDASLTKKMTAAAFLEPVTEAATHLSAGKGAFFDGATSGQKIQYNTTTNSIIGTDDFTVWCKVKMPPASGNTAGASRFLFSASNAADAGSTSYTGTTIGFECSLIMTGTGTPGLFRITAKAVNGNRYHDIAAADFSLKYADKVVNFFVTRYTNSGGASVFSFFANGESLGFAIEGSSVVLPTNASVANLFVNIGSNGAVSSTNSWLGSIYNFALYNRELSVADMKAVDSDGVSASDKGARGAAVTKVATSTASSANITCTAHGYVAGNAIRFIVNSAGNGFLNGKIYYVITNVDANNFTASDTHGGTPITASGSANIVLAHLLYTDSIGTPAVWASSANNTPNVPAFASGVLTAVKGTGTGYLGVRRAFADTNAALIIGKRYRVEGTITNTVGADNYFVFTTGGVADQTTVTPSFPELFKGTLISNTATASTYSEFVAKTQTLHLAASTSNTSLTQTTPAAGFFTAKDIVIKRVGAVLEADLTDESFQDTAYVPISGWGTIWNAAGAVGVAPSSNATPSLQNSVTVSPSSATFANSSGRPTVSGYKSVNTTYNTLQPFNVTATSGGLTSTFGNITATAGNILGNKIMDPNLKRNGLWVGSNSDANPVNNYVRVVCDGQANSTATTTIIANVAGGVSATAKNILIGGTDNSTDVNNGIGLKQGSAGSATAGPHCYIYWDGTTGNTGLKVKITDGTTAFSKTITLT